jgi:hypothetical protein
VQAAAAATDETASLQLLQLLLLWAVCTLAKQMMQCSLQLANAAAAEDEIFLAVLCQVDAHLQQQQQ